MGNSVYTAHYYTSGVPSSCFCAKVIISEGEIIPFSGVCQSGEAALSTPEGLVVAPALTDGAGTMQPTTTSGNIITPEHHFQL